MNVLVLVDIEQRHKDILLSSIKDGNFVFSLPNEVSDEEVKKADIIVGAVKLDQIKDSKNLKLLQLEMAGTGAYAKKGNLPKGTILTNASGAYGLAISEHMIGSVFELNKKLNLYRYNQMAHNWKDEGRVTAIQGSTTLVVGLGDIGGEFAKRMKALGSYTIGIKRNLSSKPEYLDELYTLDNLEDVLPRADFIALSLPETKDTIKLFGKEKFELMKKSAIVLNVGRGTVIDTEDLCDAVENGTIYGAALDVTDPEPLPSDHRIWDIKNITITPHISGGHHLVETVDKIVEISAYNIKAFAEGRDLINIVDFETGYRKFINK